MKYQPEVSATYDLGERHTHQNVHHSLGQYHTFPAYTVTYSPRVVEAMKTIYSEYNHAFVPLVEKNKEHDTDYQYCLQGAEQVPQNYAVQFDMAGLDEVFLRTAEDLPMDQLINVLKGRVFEIENSVAMYKLLGMMFADHMGKSQFKTGLRRVLEDLRVRHNMKIALLAVTDEKHEAMRLTEFGKEAGEPLSHNEVEEISGFDVLLSPYEFLQALEEHHGESPYLLYVRSSDPLSRLRNPKEHIEHPLLQNADIRRKIRAATLTLNVDDPAMPRELRINDTKEYLPLLGMGHVIQTEEELYGTALSEHLARQKPYHAYEGKRLHKNVQMFLETRGIDTQDVEDSKVVLRAKPAKETFGCYGHVRGTLDDKDFQRGLRKGLVERGAYIIQPELEIPQLIDQTRGEIYGYIDRVFLGMIGGTPEFIGGFRSMMPTHTEEFKRGRNHGNGDTVYAQISTR